MSRTRIISLGAVAAVIALTGACSLKPKETGETVVVYAASGDRTPSEADLNRAQDVLRERVAGAGLAKPNFTRIDDHMLEMHIPGHHRDVDFGGLGSPTQLSFRKVLNMTGPSGSPEVKPPGAPATVDAVLAKLGPATVAAANALTGPTELRVPALEAFAALTPAEVAVLPVNLQFNVSQISCATLKARPHGAIDDAKQFVACDTENSAKYLLDVAKTVGTDVRSAKAASIDGGQQVVTLSFTSDGQARWTALTKEAFGNTGTPPCAEASLAEGNCLVGIVVDGVVISAPSILGVLTGDSQIYAPGFTAQQIKLLAARLNSGTLPIGFTVTSVTERD